MSDISLGSLILKALISPGYSLLVDFGAALTVNTIRKKDLEVSERSLVGSRRRCLTCVDIVYISVFKEKLKVLFICIKFSKYHLGLEYI